jgi:hypothetical protein
MKNKILIHIEGETEQGKIYFHRLVDFQTVMLAVAEMLLRSEIVQTDKPAEPAKRKRGRPRKEPSTD